MAKEEPRPQPVKQEVAEKNNKPTNCVREQQLPEHEIESYISENKNRVSRRRNLLLLQIQGNCAFIEKKTQQPKEFTYIKPQLF